VPAATNSARSPAAQAGGAAAARGGGGGAPPASSLQELLKQRTGQSSLVATSSPVAAPADLHARKKAWLKTGVVALRSVF
jgi:hypothetical protein